MHYKLSLLPVKYNEILYIEDIRKIRLLWEEWKERVQGNFLLSKFYDHQLSLMVLSYDTLLLTPFQTLIQN